MQESDSNLNVKELQYLKFELGFSGTNSCLLFHTKTLTQWGRDKMEEILQIVFSNKFFKCIL